MAKRTNSLAAILRSVGALRESERVSFALNWEPLSTLIDRITDASGVYMLGSVRPLNYPSAISQVVYIGSSENLRKRLLTHRSTVHNTVIESLRSVFGSDLLAYHVPLAGLKTAGLRTIEAETLWAFERRCGLVPIANLDIPESQLRDGYFGLIRIEEACDASQAVGLDELAGKLGCVLRCDELSPLGRPGEIKLCLSLDISTGTLAVDNKYKAARFVPLEVIARQKRENLQRQAWIQPEHVAAWSEQKVRDLAAISRVLVPTVSKAKSVRRFEALTISTPSPHTWGEVAIVLGRTVLGTWYPAEKVVVKIWHARTLLGEAWFQDYLFEGYDRANLPQTEIRRPSYFEITPSEPIPKASDGDYETISKQSGTDVFGEEVDDVTIRLRDDASVRLSQNLDEYHQRQQDTMLATIERVFQAAQRN